MEKTEKKVFFSTELKTDFVFNSISKHKYSYALSDSVSKKDFRKISLPWGDYYSFVLKYSSLCGWGIYGSIPSTAPCGRPSEKFIGFISEADLVRFIEWAELKDGKSRISSILCEFGLSDFLTSFYRIYHSYLSKRGLNYVQERILF